ncbi:MAG: glycoside hydrolase family 127 protein, partial [Alistipes sp.]|nr:glycoside hydrolase family 127 protein [Candidatus Minthomonas equi]
MKTIFMTMAAMCCISACNVSGGSENESPKAMQQVDFSPVIIKDAFWSPRLENNARNTIPVCIDQIENQTGRMRNFEKAAIPEGPHSGIFFDDSDVYKAVEGMAYSLINNPDPALEAKADEWIDKFAAAQQEDGYINTFFTIAEPERRWVDMDKHEMYCAGHLLEAGVAYYKATGKRKLLDVGQKMVDYMMTIFGLGKRDWVPGHEEIELALVKLYEVSGEKKYLDFAYWLLEERGHNIGTYDVHEGMARQWDVLQYQDAFPVRELKEISGHAVRAMYLFCGMCDVTSYMPETGYMDALDRLWNDVTGTRMYITGGIGVAYRTEGFAAPFELPNYEA